MAEVESAYVTQKLEPLLQEMVQQILMNKPSNPIPMMIGWLRERNGETNLSRSEKEELIQLRQEVARLKVKMGTQSGSESSTDSDEDDYIDELPIPKANFKKPRASISDEAFGDWNRVESFKLVEIQKTPEQYKAINERMNQSFMFAALDEKEREIVISAMEERKVEAGDVVIEQDSEGNELYVIDTGELDCLKRFKPGAEPSYLKTYYPGDSFGELALLYNAPRAAQIVAKTDWVLWQLDRTTFNHIVKGASNRMRERYEDFVKNVTLLESLEPYERDRLSDAFKTATFEAEETIIREGDWGDVFYILEEGEAIATKTLTPGQEPQEVMQYKVGDYFGELSLLRGEPRAANVISKTKVKVVTLDRHSFKRMLGPLEEILKRQEEKYEAILKSKSA